MNQPKRKNLLIALASLFLLGGCQSEVTYASFIQKAGEVSSHPYTKVIADGFVRTTTKKSIHDYKIDQIEYYLEETTSRFTTNTISESAYYSSSYVNFMAKGILSESEADSSSTYYYGSSEGFKAHTTITGETVSEQTIEFNSYGLITTISINTTKSKGEESNTLKLDITYTYSK